MHLMIPFASALTDAAQHTLRDLSLPNLSRLLARVTATTRWGGDEYNLSMPHELALAKAWGWQGDDGNWPWAAQHAEADGIPTGSQAWGELTPVHWHVGTDHVTVTDPSLLHLSAQESHTLLEAIRPLFESEQWTVAWGSPNRWYAAHDSLAGLPSASIDRVIGRNLDLWMPEHPQARQIKRLQNEVQMLLYQHPLNDERIGRGALPVNSFWLSGCGRHQPAPKTPDLHVALQLRAPLLADDWVTWAQAWHELDAGAVRDLLTTVQRGEPATLTLCGERHAQTFEVRPQSVFKRLSAAWRSVSPAPVLEAL